MVGWVGEPDVALAVDDEVVRREERAVVARDVDDVLDRPVRAHALQPGSDRPVRRRIVVQADTGEVDPAVLGDEEPTVACEDRGVRTPADVGDARDRARGQVDALDGARGHGRAHQ